MNGTAVKIAIFRACATTLLGLDLDPDQSRIAANLFRDGELGSRLAALLDGLATPELIAETDEHSSERTSSDADLSKTPKAKPKKSVDVSALTIFEDVKRKKINKSQLFSLLKQINEKVFFDFPDDISMRESLVHFERAAPKEDWTFLVSVIRGSSGLDPYLAQLTSIRR